jgi:phage terminase small subunit
MPRRSQASLTVVRRRADGRPSRLSPPADMTESERTLFLRLVSGCTPEHFRSTDAPLLQEYVQQALLARQAAEEMRAAGGAVVDGKVSPWFAVQQRAVKTMCVLATRLRLSPQTRIDPKTVGKKVSPTSFYELEREIADGA